MCRHKQLVKSTGLVRRERKKTCFAERTIESGHVTFNFGCRVTSECTNTTHEIPASIVGRRSTGTKTVCTQCCGRSRCNQRLCSLDGTETVHGMWSVWTKWTSCDVACGSGQRSRSRSCTNPAPTNGGMDCNGASAATEICDTGKKCPVYGHWSTWTRWGACSVSCGVGLQRRDRACKSPNSGNGVCQGDARDDRHCFEKACSDGGWGSWSSWDRCSVTCDTGLTHRHRVCNHPTPSQFGKPCAGDATDAKLCKVSSCDKDGHWTTWSRWGSCSQTCGDGIRSRTRSCTNPTPSAHGRQCSGNHKDLKSCHNTTPCPVNGHWASWSQWSSPDPICFSGLIGCVCHRSRSCIGPYLGGQRCAGTSSQTCKSSHMGKDFCKHSCH